MLVIAVLQASSTACPTFLRGTPNIGGFFLVFVML
jgi:hypothetical protein